MLNGFNPRHVQRIGPLFNYQGEAVSATERDWDAGNKKVLIVLPTGGGKTRVAGELIAREVEKGNDSLMLAHTRKLVNQFAEKTQKDYGIWSEVEMGMKLANKECPLVCATIQTWTNRMKQPKLKYNPALLTFDEAHRALSDGYRQVGEYYANSRFLGITATPRRGDQRDLMAFFDSKAIDIPLDRLINEGYLSPLSIENCPISIELKREKGAKGDYTEQEIAHAIEPYLESCAKQLVGYRGKCMMVFLPLIAISKKFAGILERHGLKVRHVDGDSDEEYVNESIAMLELGLIDVICNSMLLTEGVDIRPVNLILNLRPTRSWTLYTQICGRGTRTFNPGNLDHFSRKAQEMLRAGYKCLWDIKEDCILLDPLWLCEDHNLLQRPSCLIAVSDEEAIEIDEMIKKSGGGKKGLLDMKGCVLEERAESLRKRLERMAQRKNRLVDAMQFFGNIGRMDMVDYEPITRWETSDMTRGQKDILIANGVNLQTVKGQGHASKIIESIMDRSKKGLCTLPQARYAESLGMRDAWMRTKSEVSNFINRCKNSGGKDPYRSIPE